MNNYTQDTFQKFTKKTKQYDSTDNKDKKQSYHQLRNMKRNWGQG